MYFKRKLLVSAIVMTLPAFGFAQAEMEEVVVLGEFVPDEKRNTSEIANVLDTEALDLLADSSVGDALARVTGLSLVGGKYVYVRGLGERYSSTLLDGSRISSPVPFQKTVPLDIVPKSIVKDLLVQKTYSAQYPGDFSGGVVDIRTRATPDENYIEIEFGGGGDSESTGGDGLEYRGGNWDNWGYDDGTRDLPDNIAGLTSEQFDDAEFPQDLGLGASFYNFWDVAEKELKPNVDADLEVGLVYEMDNGLELGFIGAGSYSNAYKLREQSLIRRRFPTAGADPVTTTEYERNTTTHQIDLSGFYSLGAVYNDHSVVLSHTVLRQTTDETQQSRGFSAETDIATGIFVENYRLQWTENEIASTALKGEHYFDITDDIIGAVLNWRIVDGSGERQAPDIRTYSYARNAQDQDEVITGNRQAAQDTREVFRSPDRTYQELDDTIDEYGIDLDVPFLIGEAIELNVKVGYSTFERTRQTSDRLFRFQLDSGAPDYVSLMTPSQLFSIDNWGAGFLDVRDFTSLAANASGIFPFAESGEEIDAYYIALDAQVTPRIRIQAGVREEDTVLFADAFGGNTLQDTTNAISQDLTDTLPSASLTWEFINDMQVRFAYSETVNRPSLLEITGTTIVNSENSNTYRGNTDLVPASVENYDIRWEWYFGFDDSASIGVFTKDFEDPIELGKVTAANDIFTWFNGDSAELDGVELEIRKALPFDQWFDWGADWDYFTVTANLSFIDSEVLLLNAGETAADVPLTGNDRLSPLFARERRLSGQSDELGNLILSYSNLDRGIEGSLAYNYTGDRIVLVGDQNQPDIVEDSRGRVDLMLKYFFEAWNSEVELEFKLRNLTDEEVLWTQGGFEYERWDEGMSYSLTLKARL